MIPKRYIPDYLTEEDKQKAKENIEESRKAYKRGQYIERIKLKSAKTKKSNWTTEFKKKYGDLNKNEIIKLLENKGAINASNAVDEILKKGKGAFYSSGSRPLQTSFSWAWARLYSVLLGGNSRDIDKDIVDKYNIPLL
jgi:hypothetical protein